MKGLITAINFLTCIPLKPKNDLAKLEASHALVYFPFVGLIIGIILVLVYSLFNFLPQQVVFLSVLISLTIITGGLHLDGFADTLEGLYAGKTKEEALHIMRDTNRGTIGILGLVIIVLSKFIFLNELPAQILLPSLILMPVLSRYALVLAIFTSNYARAEGKAKIFYQNKRPIDLYASTAVCLFVVIALLKLKGLVIFFLICLAALLINKFITRKIGGLTGDALGAISELAEVLTLFAIIVLWIK